MIRVLPLLLLAFKIWMAVDAGRKQQPFYWFLIIFFVPFGDVVYFFVVKIHDFKAPKVTTLLRSPPTIDELRHRYRENPCIDNRLALGRGLADAGRHVEAIVEFEGVCQSRPDEPDALWGLGMSRAALGELEEATAALTRLLAVAPSYNDWGTWVTLASIQHKRGMQSEALETLRTLVRKSARTDHQMLLAEALIAVQRYDEAAGLLDRIVEEDQHAPDYIQRRDRKVVARARRLRDDMARARGAAAAGS